MSDKVVEVIWHKPTQSIKFRFHKDDVFQEFLPYKSEFDRRYKLWRIIKMAVNNTVFNTDLPIRTNGYSKDSSEPFTVFFGHDGKLEFLQPEDLDFHNMEETYWRIIEQIRDYYNNGPTLTLEFERPDLEL